MFFLLFFFFYWFFVSMCVFVLKTVIYTWMSRVPQTFPDIVLLVAQFIYLLSLFILLHALCLLLSSLFLSFFSLWQFSCLDVVFESRWLIWIIWGGCCHRWSSINQYCLRSVWDLSKPRDSAGHVIRRVMWFGGSCELAGHVTSSPDHFSFSTVHWFWV